MGSILCIPKDEAVLLLEKATEVNTRANRDSLAESENSIMFSPRR